MQHFIFDFDGTISDSYPMFVKIGKQIIKEQNAVNPFDDKELLRVFKQSNALNMAVEVGLVVGITAAATPTGSAIRVYPFASSRSNTPQVFSSLYRL